MSANVAVRPLLLKPQWMNGLSERLLVSHYVNNYGGALRRLNAIRARLAALDWGRTPVFEINGIKREELIAAGSVILHEIYFDSLGGHGDDPPTGLIEPPTGLAQALERDFGSISAWTAEFTAMAKALTGGSGWAILAWSERLGRLVNHWADHAHNLPAAIPILAISNCCGCSRGRFSHSRRRLVALAGSENFSDPCCGADDVTCSASRRTPSVDRRPSLHQSQQRPRPAIFRRRDHRGCDD